tara:strand:- start:389 stop:574 length:186 start_codon:yes stop_codon:yes gene_type:complete
MSKKKKKVTWEEVVEWSIKEGMSPIDFINIVIECLDKNKIKDSELKKGLLTIKRNIDINLN